jgi:hypothetical protein
MSVKLKKMGPPTRKGTGAEQVLTYEVSYTGRRRGEATTVTADVEVELHPFYVEPDERCRVRLIIDFPRASTVPGALEELYRILGCITKGFEEDRSRDARCGTTVPLSFRIEPPEPTGPVECCRLVSPKDDRDFCERPMGHDGRHYTSGMHGSRCWFEDDGDVSYEFDDGYVLEDWIDPETLPEDQRKARFPWHEEE